MTCLCAHQCAHVNIKEVLMLSFTCVLGKNAGENSQLTEAVVDSQLPISQRCELDHRRLDPFHDQVCEEFVNLFRLIEHRLKSGRNICIEEIIATTLLLRL